MESTIDQQLTNALARFKQGRPEYTDKQKQYLSGLVSSALGAETVSDELFFSTVSQFLEKEISFWSDIEQADFNKLIHICQGKTLASASRVKYMQSIMSLEQVNAKLGKKIDSWDQLTVLNIKHLTTEASRFQLIPRSIPITAEDEYEYGYQLYVNKPGYKMYYLRFYNLMMLDFDQLSIEQITDKLSTFAANGFVFKIYKTFNGYHVFVLNQEFPHSQRESYTLMRVLDCDNFYCLFSYKYGYNIRLNKKQGRDEEYVARYHSTIGDEKNIRPELAELMTVHDRYLAMFQYD